MAQQQNNDPINTLPEYEVRTMEDDLSRAEGKIIEPRMVNLKVPEIQIPKPKTEKVPLSVKVPAKVDEPPKELPIVKVPKSSLPDIEDFIVPVPIPVPLPIKPPTPLTPAPVPVPTKTIEPVTSEDDEIEKTIRAHKTKKLLTILGIIAIVVIAINLIGYLIIAALKKPESITPPITSQPEISKSLIKIDTTKILKIENNVSLIDLLTNEESSGQQEQTLKRIVPTKSNDNELTLGELIEALQIYVPPYARAELKENYTLVIYKQNNQQRVGLIVETNNSNNFLEQSKLWEKTMPDNLKNLFLNHQPSNLATKGFSDNQYNGTSVRYVNFPSPELTIDYVISNNLFLLSTSKESIYNIIDKLK